MEQQPAQQDGTGQHGDVEEGVLLYYKFVPLLGPTQDSVTEWMRHMCTHLGLRGRVRVAEDGINVTLGGHMGALRDHMAHVMAHPLLKEGTPIDFKLAVSEGPVNARTSQETGFTQLHVKKCKELVTLGPLTAGRADPHLHAAPHLTPQQFHAMLQQAAADAAAAATAAAAVAAATTPGEQGQASAGAAAMATANSTQSEQGQIAAGSAAAARGQDAAANAHAQPSSTEAQASATVTLLGGTHAQLSSTAVQQELPTAPCTQRATGTPQQAPGGAVLLDARNVYETRVGHFNVEGVPLLDPRTRCYSELPAWLEANAHQLVNKRVLMYCTGGVRCERASAYLRELGVTDVVQLQGGIQRYLEAFPDGGMFLGKNFVYDDRIAVGPAAATQLCSTPACPEGSAGSHPAVQVGNVLAGCTEQQQQQQQLPPPPPLPSLQQPQQQPQQQHQQQQQQQEACCPGQGDTCTGQGQQPLSAQGGMDNQGQQPPPAQGVVDQGQQPLPVQGVVDQGQQPFPAQRSVVGMCMVCGCPWDDYSARRRCRHCRLLLLVCDTCHHNSLGQPSTSLGQPTTFVGQPSSNSHGQPYTSLGQPSTLLCELCTATAPSASVAGLHPAQDKGDGATSSSRSSSSRRAKGAPRQAAKATQPEAAKPKAARLRILCLHGFRHTATGFQGRTHAFCHKLRDLAEFHFVDAPHTLPHFYKQRAHTSSSSQDPEGDKSDQPPGAPLPPITAHRRAWMVSPQLLAWQQQQEQQQQQQQQEVAWEVAPDFISPSDSQQYLQETEGWSRARDRLTQTMEEYGPFDGVLGFSQGAGIAALLCAHQQQRQQHMQAQQQQVQQQQQQQVQPPQQQQQPQLQQMQQPQAHQQQGLQQQQVQQPPLNFQFALLASGYPPPGPEAQQLLSDAGTLHLPSLHMFGAEGTNDKQIGPAASLALAGLFDPSSRAVVRHGSGHIIPGNRAHVDAVRRFLLQFPPRPLDAHGQV